MFSDLNKDQPRSLDEIKVAIENLQQQHTALGHPLSGRVLHVCHYIPVTCSFNDGQPLTPPKTPDSESHAERKENTSIADGSSKSGSKWTLKSRSGHTAMISGIRSLSEQAIVGWTGELLDEHTNQTLPFASLQETDKKKLEDAISTYKEAGESRHVSLHPVWLEDKVARGHYEGYCKNSKSLLMSLPLSSWCFTVLWPLFHYLLWEDASSPSVNSDADWQAYVQANEAYARRVAEVYQKGDLVWIHDYHLLLVPGILRRLVPDALIGLFVHTPFPSSEIFRCLPSTYFHPHVSLIFIDNLSERKEVLDGMLGANLVCFQVSTIFPCASYLISTADILILPTFHLLLHPSLWVWECPWRRRLWGTYHCRCSLCSRHRYWKGN